MTAVLYDQHRLKRLRSNQSIFLGPHFRTLSIVAVGGQQSWSAMQEVHAGEQSMRGFGFQDGVLFGLSQSVCQLERDSAEVNTQAHMDGKLSIMFEGYKATTQRLGCRCNLYAVKWSQLHIALPEKDRLDMSRILIRLCKAIAVPLGCLEPARGGNLSGLRYAPCLAPSPHA
jgi:hypothetical protein